MGLINRAIITKLEESLESRKTSQSWLSRLPRKIFFHFSTAAQFVTFFIHIRAIEFIRKIKYHYNSKQHYLFEFLRQMPDEELIKLNINLEKKKTGGWLWSVEYVYMA